jgi:hypothetical protein
MDCCAAQILRRNRDFDAMNDIECAEGDDIAANALTWRRSVPGYALYLRDRGQALATVERDTAYPDMWRVHQPDRWVSDMARLEWAKEGAMPHLPRRIKPQRTPAGRPPMRERRAA